MPVSRPLIILLATMVGVAATVSLGQWQLRRADEKRQLHAAMQARQSLPPLSNADLPCKQPDWEAQHYRPVRLRGQWLAARTVWLDNRPMNGRAGQLVLTPLRLLPAGGCGAETVLVQRGWVPRDPLDRARVLPVPTSEGVVQITGRLVGPPSRLMQLSDRDDVGALRQNVALQALASEWGVALLPGSVQQDADEAPVPAGGTGLGRDWWQPGAEVGKHQAYAAQWFAMAAIMAGLYGWFQWWRPRRSPPAGS